MQVWQHLLDGAEFERCQLAFDDRYARACGYRLLIGLAVLAPFVINYGLKRMMTREE